MATLERVVMAGLSALAASVGGQQVMDLDASVNPGITVASGTWDFNTTVLWTADGGATRVPWSSNANIARIQHNYSTGSPTLTVANGNGQVGTAGIVVSGNSADWTVVKLAGDVLQVGNGGIARRIANATISFQTDNTIELTASQTWTNITPARLYNGGVFIVNGPISGTGNLVLDGADASDPGSVGGNDLRVGFRMTKNNTFSGSLTIARGAFLWLPYAVGVTNCLGDNSTLVLRGGSLRLQGGSGVEKVASVLVQAGAGHIGSGDSGVKTTLAMGSVAQQPGGTLNVASASQATTTTLNTDGILGGWATVGGQWAVGSADGSPFLSTTSGTWRSAPSGWVTGDNVDARGGGALDHDVTINSLRLYNQSPATPIHLGAHTVTVSSGGILGAYSTGNELLGGVIRSGRSSGELFVHTPYATTIGSEIADNGATPTVLVKSGASTARLTLTGACSLTGGVYLNSGTLALTNNAALSCPVAQAGGTILDVRGGGALSPGGTSAATLTLNGNLTLGDGAVLALQVGDGSDVLELTNPFATLTGAATAGGVTVNVADGGNIARQAYPLVRWRTGAALSSLDLSDFTVALPEGYEGVVQFGANCIELNVTTVPATATLLLVR